jgi:hypothetical protein
MTPILSCSGHIIDLVKRLRENFFSQFLASFKVPNAGAGLVEAQNEHFKSNFRLDTAGNGDHPYFYLGIGQEISARHHCPFCVIVTSAIDIGNEVTGNEELHVKFAR